MRVIISFLVIIGIFFFAVAFFTLLKNINFSNTFQLWFWISFTGSAILFYAILDNMAYIAVFEHELTHNIWAILTFNRPEGFHVYRDDSGGLFEYNGRGNALQSLAPYFFLTFSILLLLFHNLIKPDYYLHFYIVLGIFTGFHTSTTIKETGLYQTDIQRYGVFFSILIIILGNIINYGTVIAFTQARWNGVGLFFKDGFLIMYDSILFALNFIIQLF